MNLREAAVQAARRGADVLRAAVQREVRVSYKSAIDPVTEADQQSEQAITAYIRATFPDHQILAEESGQSGGDGEVRWVIDPLDGTVNFAHGIPHFCVLVAVQERRNGHYETIVGVTLDPLRNDMYVASRGAGATCNDRPLRVSQVDTLIRSSVATSFGYDRLWQTDDNHAEFCRLNLLTQGARRMGAAGLDLAYVAAGRFDAYWEYHLKPWDMAAGLLLVQEAGGQVTRIDGTALQPDDDSILVSNGHLHESCVAALASARRHPINAREGLAPLLPQALAQRLLATSKPSR